MAARTLVPDMVRDLRIRVFNLTESTLRLVAGQDLGALESVLAIDILRRYADVFSKGEDDLGCTDFVQHRIDTSKQPPFRQ